MGFLDYFFNSSKDQKDHQIQFGRFSDSHKDEDKYDAWDSSLELFEDGKYLEAYSQFFFYLSDESVNNVVIEEKPQEIDFTFYQGSKTIKGKVTTKRIFAEAKIAKTNGLHIGFLRKLLEDNYHLKYCRYALDDDHNITVVFNSYVVDGNPYKLYYALKELSTHADKKDDVLIEEFDSLTAINNGHIRTIDEDEKRIKFSYIQDEVERTIRLVDNVNLNISKYPGAESYAYLDLIYRLDYLIKPEGFVMEVIDKAHQLYFDNKAISPEQKNRELRKLLRKIQKCSFDEVSREIYEVKSTFGLSQPSGQTRIQEFIQSEVKNMDWYYQNGHYDIAECIPSYIVGYSLFSYSMPAPMREMFNLYFQITQNPYFSSLGITKTDKGNIDKSYVRSSLKKILANHSHSYFDLSADYRSLSFTDFSTFSKTYLLMVSNIDFKRRDHR